MNNAMKEKALNAKIVYTDLCDLDKHFRRIVSTSKTRWFFPYKLMREFCLKGKLSAFVIEGGELIKLMESTDNFQDMHELICGFNDALKHYRPYFVKAFIFTGMFTNENVEDMFDVYTCGGEV